MPQSKVRMMRAVNMKLPDPTVLARFRVLVLPDHSRRTLREYRDREKQCDNLDDNKFQFHVSSYQLHGDVLTLATAFGTQRTTPS